MKKDGHDATPTAAEQDTALAALADFARRELGGIMPISFNTEKKAWCEQLGTKAELSATEPFIVDPLSFTVAAKRFWENAAGKTEVTHVVGPGRPIDGFVLPDQTMFPDRDEKKWQLGRKGKPRDPWSREYGIVLKSQDGELYVWRTGYDGKPTLNAVVRLYLRDQRLHPGLMPVYLLGYREQSGKVFPALKPTGEWRAFGDGASPPPNPALAPKIDPSLFAPRTGEEKLKPTIGEETQDEIPFCDGRGT